MGYSVAFSIMCNDQIRLNGIPVTSDIYPIFVLGIFEILFASNFEIFNELLSAIVILLCYRILEVIPPIQPHPHCQRGEDFPCSEHKEMMNLR
jgi:hypothetical protein